MCSYANVITRAQERSPCLDVPEISSLKFVYFRLPSVSIVCAERIVKFDDANLSVEFVVLLKVY